MLLIMAWRNIWRNPTRSLVVMAAIALGIWAALFMTGFATGMARSYVNNAIAEVVSHLQIHHPQFKDNQDVTYTIADADHLVDNIRRQPGIRAVSARSLTNAMLASSKGTRGIQVKGIIPEAEGDISQLHEKVVEGTYFDGRKNQLLIGSELADKLEVGPRKKLVLTFQDTEGTITAGAFRIVGLFESGNSGFDERFVFVRKQDLNALLHPNGQSGDLTHEVAVLLENSETVGNLQRTLQTTFPDLLIETYREVAPDLQLYEEQIQYVSLIYLTIIMLALVFGIINTMLMAVLERQRELGMLMAIGMNKPRVFGMIVLETLMLCLVGAPLGLLLGGLTNWWLVTQGLDLSAFSESLRMFGMSERVYFDLDPVVYWQVPLLLIITALLAAVYPALRAIRLRPVEAIR